MESDVNMVEGMAYYETLELYWVDSNGETYGPQGDPVGTVEDHYAPPQQVLIKTGKGDKYTEDDEMDWSMVLNAIIFAIIIVIAFILGGAIMGGKKGGGETRQEQPYEPPNDEFDNYEPYQMPEEEPMTEPEEDLPMPEDEPLEDEDRPKRKRRFED
jgi:hypothetical protein